MKCGQEVRVVERRVLLETLASQLPRDSTQYSSQLQSVEASPNGDTLLELVNGSKLLAKRVARWLCSCFPTKVYWFICFNSPSPGPKITDSLVLKKQATELVKNWPSELLNIVDSTPG
ncbi:Zeaxanthin epoxidase [Spatholobus suberectus]|nr:Zeaxanthin epoxidase [Spatholobus suberectus]